MSVNSKEAKKIIRKRILFGCVPRRLEIAGLPQFNNYPLNVLFMSYTKKDGELIMGIALYKPEFYTYRKDGHLSFMRYRNAYGGDCYLVISYDEEKKLYHGEKFVNGNLVSSANGGDDWNMFFVHLTMTGLANGERCMFKKIG